MWHRKIESERIDRSFTMKENAEAEDSASDWEGSREEIFSEDEIKRADGHFNSLLKSSDARSDIDNSDPWGTPLTPSPIEDEEVNERQN